MQVILAKNSNIESSVYSGFCFIHGVQFIQDSVLSTGFSLDRFKLENYLPKFGT
jgi:hypothetical protein